STGGWWACSSSTLWAGFWAAAALCGPASSLRRWGRPPCAASRASLPAVRRKKDGEKGSRTVKKSPPGRRMRPGGADTGTGRRARPFFARGLQQVNAGIFAGFAGGGVPDRGLHLADVGAAQKQHAQPALADAAADGASQLAGQQRLVEGQGPAAVAARLGQLAVQALGADPDAHAAQLVAAGQRVVPEQQVAVQVPVVVVGGAAVVGFAAAQLVPDLHQEGGAV